MKPHKVISALESTIARVTRDIKKKQGNIGSDKINSLSKLINSYSRLVERSKNGSDADESDNDYDQMERQCLKK